VFSSLQRGLRIRSDGAIRAIGSSGDEIEPPPESDKNWLETAEATTDRAQKLRLLGTRLIEYDYAGGKSAAQVVTDGEDKIVKITAKTDDPSQNFVVEKDSTDRYKISFDNGSGYFVDQSNSQPNIKVDPKTGEITVTYLDTDKRHHWIRYRANGTVEHKLGDP
jgi:hypothetical protein